MGVESGRHEAIFDMDLTVLYGYSIPEVVSNVRRAIADELALGSWWWAGRMDEPDFLSRIYPMKDLPSRGMVWEMWSPPYRVAARRLPCDRAATPGAELHDSGIESDVLIGAGSENRTRTLFPEPDFESGASTSSAIPAERRQV